MTTFIEQLQKHSEDLKAGRTPEPIVHSNPITPEEAEYECGSGYPDAFRERKPVVGFVTTIGPQGGTGPNTGLTQPELMSRCLQSINRSDVPQPIIFHVHGWNADKEGLSVAADRYLARCTAVPMVARNLEDDDLVVYTDTDIIFPWVWYDYVRLVFDNRPELGMAYPSYRAESALGEVMDVTLFTPKDVLDKLAGKATDHCIFFRAKMVKDYLWFTEDWMLWKMFKGWKIAQLPVVFTHLK